MCGIVAYAARTRPVDPAAIERALEALHHRGPDGRGRWANADCTVALGHTRLAIVDPEHGQQPLCNEDESIWAVVNGEFYDDARLRAQLEREGHRFRTRSDSELLVHLYETLGVACVHRLRGEFAAVLWDAKNRVLLAIRDRFGIKPLVYHQTPERIVLASEAKALFAAGEVTPAWDLRAVANATTLQYVPPDRTFFDGVRQLEPGHMLVWTDGQARVSKYWDLYERRGSKVVTSEEVAEAFEAQLSEAVRLRLRADVPVAFTLSGGVDSSTVAGFAREHGTVSAYYTVTFDESIDRENYNEEHLAKATSEYLGGDFCPVRVSRRDLIEALPRAVYFSEGTSINAHLPAKYLLSERIRRDGYRVILSGEGADEVLLGYPHLRDDFLAGAGAAGARAALRAAHTVSMGVMLPDGETLDLAGLERRLGYVPSWVRAKAGFGARFSSLLAPAFGASQAGVDPFALLADLLPEQPQRPLPDVLRSAYLWTKLCLANYILKVLGDGTEMANSVEGRVPFLDHHFAELVFDLPLSILVGEGQEKPLLRMAARGKTIEQVRTRNKHPFLTPSLYLPSDRHAREYFADLTASYCPPFLEPAALAAFLAVERPLNEQSKYDPIYLTVACLCALQKEFAP
jgi:asparagine synthase (glutamine-hydrolysing)